MADAERAGLMATSVASAARAAGLSDGDVAFLGRAYTLAMEPRIEALHDDHDPAYLHPGRSVLVIFRDVGPLPAEVLAAATLHESEQDSLRVDVRTVREALGDSVATTLQSLPLPEDERLAERLVALEETRRIAALAERLDQLRHAHLTEDRRWWHELYEQVSAVWLPVAERTHARLAARYRHWHRTFARRVV